MRVRAAQDSIKSDKGLEVLVKDTFSFGHPQLLLWLEDMVPTTLCCHTPPFSAVSISTALECACLAQA